MTQAEPRTKATFTAPLRHFGRRALDVLLPPQCLSCGTLVEEQGALCLDCWQDVTFISQPHCAICGLPFEFAAQGNDYSDGHLCGSCVRKRPVFERARAVLAYDDASSPFILTFKHADRTEAASAFARWMARAGADVLENADLITPVPLHWSRLFKRRYNQAALLGQRLSQISAVPAIPDLLVRKRATPSQGRFSPSARKRNVRGAFQVREKYIPNISGKRVVLVDDVLTTGATASAVTRALLGAGAEAVDVLTLGRVLRPFPL
ncbi:MAG: ComF family protein [Rhodospirillaceae bacterium]|nr:ComF family protein [Rhodospirillaceae bacterium]MBT5244012.1 ComF family protein [Rhodospirillaceae bacterium]MBT5560832.1 ComF family protein [Rhodospirillaceae bacterium]MBT6240570.1 ComF family protein [Rhodospirillaceae bacterium]MBT7138360.1 ComF family protein [Rhodospirillaceae bacterium]